MEVWIWVKRTQSTMGLNNFICMEVVHLLVSYSQAQQPVKVTRYGGCFVDIREH